MEYLDSGHVEWPEMWKQMAAQTINNGDQLCVYRGHRWEYLGSTIDHHNFRHARHPKTLKTEYIYIERGRVALAWGLNLHISRKRR